VLSGAVRSTWLGGELIDPAAPRGRLLARGRRAGSRRRSHERGAQHE
jgi:hypothetical protein